MTPGLCPWLKRLFSMRTFVSGQETPAVGGRRTLWSCKREISTGIDRRSAARAPTIDMVLTERFTRTAYDTVNYEFTIDDPTTFTDKITAIVPMTKVAGQIYEYACHEGNYGMVNILRGERMAEQRAGDDS